MVKSADRALQILELVGDNKYGATQGQLSNSLNIPKSSLSLLLSNLVHRKYLSISEEGNRYFLGPQVLTLFNRFVQSNNIIRLSQPFLVQLKNATGESALLATRSETDILIVQKEDCSLPLKGSLEIGDRAPIYTTAAGKAILAFQPKKELERYISSVKLLHPLAKRTITDWATFREEIERISSEGIAYSREELNEGLIGMAAPVISFNKQAVGSLVSILPSVRFSADKEKVIERALRHASAELSRQLGFEQA